jgi:hypothetical protein
VNKLKQKVRIEGFVEILDEEGNVIERVATKPKRINLEDIL